MEAFEKWWEKNHLEEKGYGALRGLSKDIWRAALKWAKSRGDRLTDTKGDYYDISVDVFEKELEGK